MLKRLACHIANLSNLPSKVNEFHRSLLINMDQTGVHLVPKSNYTWGHKKQKNVAGIGEDDKRAITAVLASSSAGDLLPAQLIFQGKTTRCHPSSIPSAIAAAGFHTTHSANHWSSQETMQEYIENVLQPYIAASIRRHNLPPSCKTILMLDCWSVHRSAEFIEYMKKHPNIILIFIPPNCTSKLQVADTTLNFRFKRHIRNSFNAETLNLLQSAFDRNATVDLKQHLFMKELKPKVLKWCFESWDAIAHTQTNIMHGWHSLFTLFDPFSSANQVHAQADVIHKAIRLDERFDKDDEEEENDIDHLEDAQDIPIANDEATALKAIEDALAAVGLSSNDLLRL